MWTGTRDGCHPTDPRSRAPAPRARRSRHHRPQSGGARAGRSNPQQGAHGGRGDEPAMLSPGDAYALSGGLRIAAGFGATYWARCPVWANVQQSHAACRPILRIPGVSSTPSPVGGDSGVPGIVRHAAACSSGSRTSPASATCHRAPRPIQRDARRPRCRVGQCRRVRWVTMGRQRQGGKKVGRSRPPGSGGTGRSRSSPAQRRPCWSGRLPHP